MNYLAYTPKRMNHTDLMLGFTLGVSGGPPAASYTIGRCLSKSFTLA